MRKKAINIIVCVKQVPATNEVKLDPITNNIIREGIESIINPFDTYAIEEAIRLKERFGGEITAISMGIPSVKELLQETVALGVDGGILMSDRSFAGADTLATAYTLSSGVKEAGEYDLIICGKMATDGDTAQVGPSLAERLGLPHLTDIGSIEEVGDDYLKVRKLTDNGYDLLEINLPAVITVTKEINTPRLPSIKGIKKAGKAEIVTLTAQDIKADPKRIGLSGSPTQVVKTFVPVQNVESEIFQGETKEQVNQLLDRLNEKGFLDN